MVDDLPTAIAMLLGFGLFVIIENFFHRWRVRKIKSNQQSKSKISTDMQDKEIRLINTCQRIKIDPPFWAVRNEKSD